jgi:hypothetical protein
MVLPLIVVVQQSALAALQLVTLSAVTPLTGLIAVLVASTQEVI